MIFLNVIDFFGPNRKRILKYLSQLIDEKEALKETSFLRKREAGLSINLYAH